MTGIWKNRKAWVVIISVGALIGFLDASEAHFVLSTVGRHIALTRLLRSYLSYWLTLAALVPSVFYVAERVPLDNTRRPGRLLVHAVAACAFAVVHLASAGFIMGLMNPAARLTFEERFVDLFRQHAAGNFFEYWSIVGLFYAIHYHRENRRVELRSAQLQAHLNDARLQALRSQLNPHFLFNTLNTVYVLAQKNDQRAVTFTLSRLSELLRATLDDRQPQEIPLTDEVIFLDKYVDIQRMRFTDRLLVQYDIAPETEHALVPSMLLQPLVENAIRYSLTEQRGRAIVTVCSVREGDALLLKVSDNGPGFGAPTEGSEHRRGIGLANTEARLEQLYGRRQAISYGSNDTAGGVVAISVPFRSGPETFVDYGEVIVSTSMPSHDHETFDSVEASIRRPG